ncbi:hypothetical protein [Humidesulfovibrio sp.]|uniref:hypothetical protein n=1 Tax=Humidesulfovibrio sp. TaxID=2910988 RepID=UPI00273362C2|nr:hypothetical protein [Humidesulfovibrio sp.]
MIRVPHANTPAPSRKPAATGNAAPAKLLYTALRHKHGLSHEEATRHLREALKSYFRTT